MVTGALGVFFFENRKLWGGTEERERVNSVGNCAAQDVFTRFNRKERQLKTQPYLAGFLLPERSVLAAEYQALGVGQRNCDLSGRHRQPQFNLEAKGHRCAAGINRVSIGRQFAFNGP